MLSRPRVLQVAYACSPVQGSEPGVGWGWATQMARWYDVWVLCEAERYGVAVQRYLDEHGPIPHLNFVYVKRPRLAHWLGRLPGFGYTAYNLWHREAYREARQLHAEIGFDLTHQVTFCGYREPGYLHRLGVPFIWGPVGGTQNYPWQFLPQAGFPGAFTEGTRSTLNGLQLRLGHRIHQAARAARTLLAANTTVQADLRRVLGFEPKLLLETGIREIREPSPREENGPRPFRILWSGDLSPWKALPLLLEALARLPKDLDYEVRILGRGKLQAGWQRLAQRLGVESRLRWLGWVPLDVALRQYAEVDMLAFTSLRDTSGNVVLEALSSGVPVVCIDHQGGRDMVDATCGIKVPLGDPVEVIQGFRDAILSLARDARLRRDLARGAVERARYYLWDRQGERMHAIYQASLAPESTALPLADSETRSESQPVRLRGPNWKERVKDAGKRFAGTMAAALRAVRGRAQNAIGILVYHRIAPCPPGVPTPTMNVTPARFRQQLIELQAQGYAIWPLRRLLDHARTGQPIEGKVAVITFDDGFACVHQEAWPILQELGLPATIFLNTAYTDSEAPFPFDPWALAHQGRVSPDTYLPLTLAQCEQMAADGRVEFGAHTHTHRDLRGQPDEFRRDLEQNLWHLRKTFGLTDATFAFPFGRRSSGHSGDDLLAAARDTGVLCALTTEAEPIDPSQDPFGWGRFNCYEWDTGATLAAKLEGWYCWAPRLQGWFASRLRAVGGKRE